MGNSGLIVANELNPRRHVPLGHTLDRLGVLNALVTAYQAQQFPLKARFDRVLADVPCSAEGRFRQTRRDAPYQVRKARTKLPDLQKKILLRGFDLLKPLGELLYATCTYDPEENESIVNFLLNNRDADLLPLDVDQHSEPGITQWKDQSYDPRVRMAARFYPHRIDSVGFFMARICRRR
jgi:16S rRNA C967 or C1407 C5-methylase (RsmB/RsmF family)